MPAFAVVAGVPDVVDAAAAAGVRGGDGSSRLFRSLLVAVGCRGLRCSLLLVSARLSFFKLGLVQRQQACGGVQEGHGAGDVICSVVPPAEVGGGEVRHRVVPRESSFACQRTGGAGPG